MPIIKTARGRRVNGIAGVTTNTSGESKWLEEFGVLMGTYGSTGTSDCCKMVPAPFHRHPTTPSRTQTMNHVLLSLTCFEMIRAPKSHAMKFGFEAQTDNVVPHFLFRLQPLLAVTSLIPSPILLRLLLLWGLRDECGIQSPRSSERPHKG